MPHFFAISSAEMPCGVSGYFSISGMWNGAPGPCMMFTPNGTRDIDSTPPPIVISHVPPWIRFAAKWTAC